MTNLLVDQHGAFFGLSTPFYQEEQIEEEWKQRNPFMLIFKWDRNSSEDSQQKEQDIFDKLNTPEWMLT